MTTRDKIVAIGISNNIKYDLYDYKMETMTGLCKLEEYTFLCWCTFEKIIIL